MNRPQKEGEMANAILKTHFCSVKIDKIYFDLACQDLACTHSVLRDSAIRMRLYAARRAMEELLSMGRETSLDLWHFLFCCLPS